MKASPKAKPALPERSDEPVDVSVSYPPPIHQSMAGSIHPSWFFLRSAGRSPVWLASVSSCLSTPRGMTIDDERLICVVLLPLAAGSCVTEDGGRGDVCGTGEGGVTDVEGNGAVCCEKPSSAIASAASGTIGAARESSTVRAPSCRWRVRALPPAGMPPRDLLINRVAF